MAHGLVAAPAVTRSCKNNHKKTRTLQSLRVFYLALSIEWGPKQFIILPCIF